MKRVGVVLLFSASACGFTGDAGPGGDDAATPGLWRLDTEADFRAAGAWLDDATTIAPGSVTIARHAHGALASAGRTGCGIGPGQQATIAWADVIAAPPLGRGFGHPNLVGTAPPAGLGLEGADELTAWWEGEAWLDAGGHELAIDADDRAFVEVMTPAGEWERVAAEGHATGTITVPATGWYPMRVAMADCGGAPALSILHRAPGATEASPLSEARLRTAVNGQTGLQVASYDDRALLFPVGMASATQIAGDWGAMRPADLGLTENNTYSLRWSGQFRIDVPGTYRFRVQSDNGHRLRIDGAVVLDYMVFGAITEDRTTGDLELAAGWHDVVLDYQEDVGTASVALTVASGPDLAGQALPVARLRPTPGPVARVASRAGRYDMAVPDLQSRSIPLWIDAPPGATVDRINVGYTIMHQYPSDLVISLTSPQGTAVTLRDRQSGAATITDRWIAIEEVAGQAAGGMWILTVEDVVSYDAGTLDRAALTVHYNGGPPATPASATYLSEVHALGPVLAIDALRWAATTPAGSAVALAIRTCATPEACTGDFVPVTASGDVPEVEAAPFAQLRATLTPAGDELPALEEIELSFTPDAIE